MQAAYSKYVESTPPEKPNAARDSREKVPKVH
jgi:hypothetical protein